MWSFPRGDLVRIGHRHCVMVPSPRRAVPEILLLLGCSVPQSQTSINTQTVFTAVVLTVMESDLSSSDAALRMLLEEDVELLDSGIFRSLLFPCLSESDSVSAPLLRSPPGWAVRSEFSLFLAHRFLIL